MNMRIILLTLCIASIVQAQDQKVFWLDHLMVVISPASSTASHITACAYDSFEQPENYAGPLLAVYAGDSFVITQLVESGQACWGADVPMPSSSIGHVRLIVRRPKRGAQ